MSKIFFSLPLGTVRSMTLFLVLLDIISVIVLGNSLEMSATFFQFCHYFLNANELIDQYYRTRVSFHSSTL